MRILVFQHVDVEHPGVFMDFWREAGHRFDQIELDAGDAIPDLAPYDLMVSMGGPMDVWQQDIHRWIRPEIDAIRRWVVHMKRPFLGICLGHQLLAEALGGTVTPMSMPEVGLSWVELTDHGLRDPLLAGFGAKIKTFQWHGAEVSRLPAGATILASNDVSHVQAMRWGRHAYGLQYHCEITASTVSDWERIPEYRASLEAAIGREGALRLGPEVKGQLDDFRAAARRMNDNLFAMMDRQTTAVSI